MSIRRTSGLCLLIATLAAGCAAPVRSGRGYQPESELDPSVVALFLQAELVLQEPIPTTRNDDRADRAAALIGEAIEIASTQPVHVLVIDVETPDMGGLDALRVIAVSGRFVPCILTTRNVTARLERDALDARAFSIIPRPVSLDQARRTVERLVNKYYGPALS